MKAKDVLGDRMKDYEGLEAQRCFMKGLPVVARIDGRAFSKFTKGMARPYCEVMMQCMIETTKGLVKETNACIGYTQSDEITLVFMPQTNKRSTWFAGRISKITSQLAAQATVLFYEQVLRLMPQYAKRRPTFDARVWQVPNQLEAANAVLWRELDAAKNSITMAASVFYSYSELKGKSGKERQELLFRKGVNWSSYPVGFKRGTYVQRVTTTSKYSLDEISKLPERHKARQDPELVISRANIEAIEMPRFGSLLNPTQVIFAGAKPVVAPEGVQATDNEGFVPEVMQSQPGSEKAA
ncbi:tRNA(His) guanylyltransferase Thg1 family protein [Pseudomonas aeruginosa]